MTVENMLWVAGLLSMPTFWGALKLMSLVKEIRNNTEGCPQTLANTEDLKTMQGATLETLNDNQKQMMKTQQDIIDSNKRADESTRLATEATSKLTHYVKWATEQQTGKEPPPPMPEV